MRGFLNRDSSKSISANNSNVFSNFFLSGKPLYFNLLMNHLTQFQDPQEIIKKLNQQLIDIKEVSFKFLGCVELQFCCCFLLCSIL